MAAEQGLPEAQFKVAICYDNGIGVENSPEQAAYWFKKAAEQDIPEAQYNLAICYYEGYGIQKSYKNTISWLKKAVQKGYTLAKEMLDDIQKNN